MKNEGLLADRKALSPVVASIILCSAVVIIGISVWSFTRNVTNSLQESYYEGVQRDIDKIGERFTVEHVAFDGSLHIWVYNYGNFTEYGDIQIVVDVSVWEYGESLGNGETTAIPSGDFREITVSLDPLPSVGSELTVKVSSRRGNDVYQRYVFPSA